MTTATLPISTLTRPWAIDATHTNVGFSSRHLMNSTVRGRFAEEEGSVAFDPATQGAFDLRVTVPIASVTTQNDQRDAHLRSPDFFDAANHPTMTFVGKRIQGDVESAFKLIGDLTIRGTTREFVLTGRREGTGNDPWGNERLGFSGSGTLNRSDYGLNWNAALETGGFVVGDEVKVHIDLELVRPTE